MADWREDRIGAAHRGENPTVLARLPGGFAVIGDLQWLPGYCVLLTDDPSVHRLSDLVKQDRLAFLDSMARLGQAVERACSDAGSVFRRVNLVPVNAILDCLGDAMTIDDTVAQYAGLTRKGVWAAAYGALLSRD